MPGIISYETGAGGLHTIVSVEPTEVQGITERSGAYTPVRLIVHDLSTPECFAEAVDDAAVASTVILTQIGQKFGRSLSWGAIAHLRQESRSTYEAPIERAKGLGHVVITLTAPTKEAAEAILPA